MAILYAARSELKTRLCLSEDDDARDAMLDNCLEASSRWIDKETNHRFYVVIPDAMAVPMGEVYYFTAGADAAVSWDSQRRGSGQQSIEIGDWVAVSQVATDQDADGVFETVWTVSTDYRLGPINAPALGQPYTTLNRNAVSGRYTFPSWESAIRLTGQRGYSTLANRPTPIRELCLMAAELLARPLLDMALPGVQAYKIGGTGSTIDVKMLDDNLPSMGKRILADYEDKSVFV